MPDSGAVVNQMIKNILQSKRPRSVKIGHSLQSQSTAKATFPQKVVKYLLTEIARFCRHFLGYTPFIALKPSRILRSAILSNNCSGRLNWIWQDFPFALHKTFHAIRYETKFCVGI